MNKICVILFADYFTICGLYQLLGYDTIRILFLKEPMKNHINTASYILTGLFLILCFIYHLIPVLIAATVVFLLITKVFNFLDPLVESKFADKITLLIVVLVIVSLIGGICTAGYYGFQVGNTGMRKMNEDIFNVLQQIKQYLPPTLIHYIPDDILVLKEKLVVLAKEHSSGIFSMTTGSAKAFVHVLVGILIGAVTAFSFLNFKDENHSGMKPFTEALYHRIANFGSVFERVLFSQGKISAINTILTAIYLLIILPLCSINVPYAKTLVILTFFLGLIPVLGNLISNVFIVLMSLTVSFEVAIASLVFLVVIHKLEYYINAKIIGAQIKTSIWEMLTAMIIMETLFGLVGVAVAPIIYGYIKEELKQKDLI